MYPITNEVKALFESEQRKVLRITGTDRNGASISITDDNVIEDSFQIDRYSCNGEKLEIGTAIAGQLTLKLENGNGTYDGIVFEDTELFAEVGVADWTQENPTIHWVPCGYFTPDDQPRRLSTISITALDRMMRFDAVSLTLVPWTTRAGDVMTTRSGEPIYFVKSIQFPCTIAQIVAQAAALCNVPFTQDLSGFPNANISIQELPVPNKDLTYRTLIQWCAAIMGCNAWIDWTGSLRFSWYENTTDYVSTIDNRYSSDLYENDLSITGVAYTNNSGIQFVEGSADYTVDIVGNLLIGAQVATMLPAINAALNGFTYRPFMAATVNAPYLWPMDIITFRDKNGNDHTSALTNVAFGLNGTTAMESKGMTYATNRGVQPSGFTKEQAQLVNEVKQSIVDLDDSLTQQEIFNRLTDNGETQGLILYNGKLYLNAEYIQAGTLVANLLLASILSIGGADNGSGGLRILDGDGNVIGTWNKNGITVSKGSITGGTINGATLTLGGSDNTSGTLTVKDSIGNTVATIDNAGVSVSKGNIAGPMISLGGLNNQNGTLRVLNAAGQEIGTWTKDGISIRRGDINLDSTGSIKVGFNAANTKYVQFNVNGMQLVLDSGAVIKTDSMGFINIPHYPNNTTFGTLNAAVKDGSETWESKFVPGYFWVGHRNDGVSDYRLEYDLETFRVIGPDGEFEVDNDNGRVYTSYDMTVIGNAVFSSVRADSLDLFYSLPIASGGTGANTAVRARENLGAMSDKAILHATSALPIPSAGSTSTGYISGLTSDHQLVRWNFSSSPENASPADLEWETFDGYFTITNNGGTTSESIMPVFILPNEEVNEP